MVTLNDLLEWETINEESVIIDGPVWLTRKQKKNFVKKVNERQDILDYICLDYIDDFYDIDIPIHGGMSTEQEKEAVYFRNELYTIYADFLNENNLKFDITN